MVIRALLTAALLLAAPTGARADADVPAGEPGGPGLALFAAKVLVCERDGRSAIDHAVVHVRDGRIEAVRARTGDDVPEGYEVRDLGDLWLAPGMIDLHSHVAMSLRDLSETAYLTNPGMRASVGVVPEYSNLLDGAAGGVTTVLHIPGSATNMGGQGVLLRTSGRTFEEMLVRDPGSLKIAQSGNPERRGPWYPGRSFMNWNTRNTIRRGLAYAARWLDHEGPGARPAADGEAPAAPARDLQFDVFRALAAGETQCSVHTQIYQVVLETLTMLRGEFDLPTYIDHGTFDGYRTAALAAEYEVPAILGPREISVPYNRAPNFVIDQDGAIFGVAAKYQEAGHPLVGFNTDTIGNPSGSGPGQEELSLQAAMGARYGFSTRDAGAVRGVTIVPAIAAGLDDRMGSLEAGKDADLIAVTGDPIDPRSSVELVLQAGHVVYDTAEDRRRF